MPLFDFEHCDERKNDVILRLADTGNEAAYPACPKCKQPMTKIVGNPGRAIFRGAGFHGVDYRAPTKGF